MTQSLWISNPMITYRTMKCLSHSTSPQCQPPLLRKLSTTSLLCQAPHLRERSTSLRCQAPILCERSKSLRCQVPHLRERSTSHRCQAPLLREPLPSTMLPWISSKLPLSLIHQLLLQCPLQITPFTPHQTDLLFCHQSKLKLKFPVHRVPPSATI